MKIYFKDGQCRIAQYNVQTQRMELVSSHDTLEEALQSIGMLEEPDPKPLPECDEEEIDLDELLQ